MCFVERDTDRHRGRDRQKNKLIKRHLDIDRNTDRQTGTKREVEGMKTDWRAGRSTNI